MRGEVSIMRVSLFVECESAIQHEVKPSRSIVRVSLFVEYVSAIQSEVKPSLSCGSEGFAFR